MTADHSHTLSINGYSVRGNDVTGAATDKERDSFESNSSTFYNVVPNSMFTVSPGYKFYGFVRRKLTL